MNLTVTFNGEPYKMKQLEMMHLDFQSQQNFQWHEVLLIIKIHLDSQTQTQTVTN